MIWVIVGHLLLTAGLLGIVAVANGGVPRPRPAAAAVVAAGCFTAAILAMARPVPNDFDKVVWVEPSTIAPPPPGWGLPR